MERLYKHNDKFDFVRPQCCHHRHDKAAFLLRKKDRWNQRQETMAKLPYCACEFLFLHLSGCGKCVNAVTTTMHLDLHAKVKAD